MEKNQIAQMNNELHTFIHQEIIPFYDRFDPAHRRDHVEKVMQESQELAIANGLDVNMACTIAAYHDLGLIAGRENHHLASGSIVRLDTRLLRWFTPTQIEIMAQAVEDHRASATHEPRSIYGRIVAEADRNINIDTIITRTIQYGLAHYPDLSHEEQIQRALNHLNDKYSRTGYLKLWMPGSRNEQELHKLWELIEHPQEIRRMVEQNFSQFSPF